MACDYVSKPCEIIHPSCRNVIGKFCTSKKVVLVSLFIQIAQNFLDNHFPLRYHYYMEHTRKSRRNASEAASVKDNEMATPSNVEEIIVQNTIFDLDSMDEVTLKKVVTFKPAANTQEALAMLGNDSAKFLEVINEGLREHARVSAKSDTSTPWKVEDEEGVETVFSGTVADAKTVNGLILNMAKSVFGYAKDMTRDAKKAAKESAMNLIRSTPAIRDGLKVQAAK